MIAEKERNEVLAKLAQTQNEELFQQVLSLVRSQEQPRRQLASPGFARQEGFWMSDDFDEPLEEFADYQ